jgi:uncharacterized protein YkwD
MGMSEPRHSIPARIVAALLVVLVAASAALALGASPAAADDVADEARLFQLTNESRLANGRGPLTYDPAASGVARSWAAELARSGSLRHNPNLVGQVDAYVTTQWSSLGENVGYAGSIDQVQAAYMNSTGHRNNILGNYNRVGVGSVRASNGYIWTAVVFILGPALPWTAPPAPPVPASTFAPFPSAGAFAWQQYTDFLGRTPDAAGLNYWANLLNTGQVTPVGLVDQFIKSAEFGQAVEPVSRLYLAFFGRDPDFGGLIFWANQLRSGFPLQGVADSFASSPEFRSMYGSLSNPAFVDRVYRNVLGRGADAGGLNYWVGQLNAGALNRGGIMVNFSESPEYRNATWARIDVVAAYLGFLRRSPDAAGLNYWQGVLWAGQGMGGLISGFISSSEYRHRLGL